jgi:hypothetical protein
MPLTFQEKRALQKIIVEQNKILAANPSFTEKRAAQKAKLDALAKLGKVKQSSISEGTENQGSGENSGTESNNDQGNSIQVAGFTSFEASQKADGSVSFTGTAKVNGESYFARIKVTRKDDGSPKIGLTDANFETFTGKPVRGKSNAKLEELMDLAKDSALNWVREYDRRLNMNQDQSADSNDSEYIKAPGGSLNFGEISSDIAAEISRSSGYIRLEQGEYDDAMAIGSGLTYIAALRESELRSTGMATVEKFVQFVAENFTEIRAVPGSKALLLSAVNEAGRIMLLTIERGTEAPYYLVTDAEAPKAGLGRRDNWKLLWRKPVDTVPVDEVAVTDPSNPGDDLDPASPNYRYKDTGNIAGSRKEIAALTIRNAAKSGVRLRANDVDWSEIEQNPREAKELITKSNLFGNVDWEGLKENGVESAAGFLVDRVYAAIGKEPSEDSPQARKDYAIGLESLRDRLESCKTPDQVTKVIDELREEMEGVTLDDAEAAAYATLKDQVSVLYDKIRAYDTEKDAVFNEYYRLSNQYDALKNKQGSRVSKKWKPDPDLDRQMAEILPLRDKAHQAYMDFLDAYPDMKDEKVELGSGRFTFANKYDMEIRDLRNQMEEVVNSARIRNRMANPLHRAWLIMGERFIKVLYYRSYKGSDAFKDHVTTAKAGKITDWSWAEKNTIERKSSTKESQRFQLLVADRFERVGGRSVTVDSTTELKEHFGLREVQSGNWVLRDVNSAKFHTEQTAAAFADLADILGVQDKTIAMSGKLAMAFGARGHGNAGFGGAARAHYEPVQRVINLTKMGGGGCLGHEWFHALDNLLSEAMTGNASGSDDYLTEGLSLMEGALKEAFTALRTALGTGGKRLPVLFSYTDKDWKTAKYNFDREQRNPSSTPARIKNAGSVLQAVLEVVKTYGEEALYNKKNNGYSWAKLAVAYYDNHAEGNKVFVNAGRMTSSFEFEATRLDGGVNGKYWSKPREMAARAFQSFLEDKLAEQGRRNDYLSVMADNKYYQDGLFGPVFPFPEGDERKSLNAAFEKLIAAMHDANAFVALDSVFAKMTGN